MAGPAACDGSKGWRSSAAKSGAPHGGHDVGERARVERAEADVADAARAALLQARLDRGGHAAGRARHRHASHAAVRPPDLRARAPEPA